MRGRNSYGSHGPAHVLPTASLHRRQTWKQVAIQQRRGDRRASSSARAQQGVLPGWRSGNSPPASANRIAQYAFWGPGRGMKRMLHLASLRLRSLKLHWDARLCAGALTVSAVRPDGRCNDPRPRNTSVTRALQLGHLRHLWRLPLDKPSDIIGTYGVPVHGG